MTQSAGLGRCRRRGHEGARGGGRGRRPGPSYRPRHDARPTAWTRDSSRTPWSRPRSPSRAVIGSPGSGWRPRASSTGRESGSCSRRTCRGGASRCGRGSPIGSACPVALDNDANCAALAESTLRRGSRHLVGADGHPRHRHRRRRRARRPGAARPQRDGRRVRAHEGRAGRAPLSVRGRGLLGAVLLGARPGPAGRARIGPSRPCWRSCAAATAAADRPMVTAAAADGDLVARQAFASIGDWLGVGVANLVAAFDPDVVVVGGGVRPRGTGCSSRPAPRSLRSLVGAAQREVPPLVQRSSAPRRGWSGRRCSRGRLGLSVDPPISACYAPPCGALAALPTLDRHPACLRACALPPHPPGDARDGGHRWIQAKPVAEQRFLAPPVADSEVVLDQPEILEHSSRVRCRSFSSRSADPSGRTNSRVGRPACSDLHSSSRATYAGVGASTKSSTSGSSWLVVTSVLARRCSPSFRQTKNGSPASGAPVERRYLARDRCRGGDRRRRRRPSAPAGRASRRGTRRAPRRRAPARGRTGRSAAPRRPEALDLEAGSAYSPS